MDIYERKNPNPSRVRIERIFESYISFIDTGYIRKLRRDETGGNLTWWALYDADGNQIHHPDLSVDELQKQAKIGRITIYALH